MKLRGDMLFAHPVLSETRDDYMTGLLETGISVKILKNSDELEIRFTLSLLCDDLADLVTRGGAGYGYFIVCRRTYFNRKVETPPGVSLQKFKLDNFFGNVEIRPVIWSTETYPGWSSKLLHAEYGGGVDLPANSILALGPDYRFTVDPARLRPFESIFALAADPEIPSGQIQVDPDGSKITIRTSPETKLAIENIRNPEEGKAILLSAVYLPALMELLHQLAGDDAMYSEKAWHRIFMAKCTEADVDVDGQSPLISAQKLLKSPFLEIERISERLFS